MKEEAIIDVSPPLYYLCWTEIYTEKNKTKQRKTKDSLGKMWFAQSTCHGCKN